MHICILSQRGLGIVYLRWTGNAKAFIRGINDVFDTRASFIYKQIAFRVSGMKKWSLAEPDETNKSKSIPDAWHTGECQRQGSCCQ